MDIFVGWSLHRLHLIFSQLPSLHLLSYLTYLCVYTKENCTRLPVLKVGHRFSTTEEDPDRKYSWVTLAGSDYLKSWRKICSFKPGINSVFGGIMNVSVFALFFHPEMFHAFRTSFVPGFHPFSEPELWHMVNMVVFSTLSRVLQEDAVQSFP